MATIYPILLKFDLDEITYPINDGTNSNPEYYGGSAWGKQDVSEKIPHTDYTSATKGCIDGTDSGIIWGSSSNLALPVWELGFMIELTGIGGGYILHSAKIGATNYAGGFDVYMTDSYFTVKLAIHNSSSFVTSPEFLHYGIANEPTHYALAFSEYTRILKIYKNNSLIHEWDCGITYQQLGFSTPTRLLRDKSDYFNWITAIYLVEGTIDEGHRIPLIYGFTAKSKIENKFTLVPDTYLIPASNIEAKTSIENYGTGEIISMIKAKTSGDFVPVVDCNFTYRLEKEASLNDREIRRNLFACNVESTYTPVAHDGKIINHISGCKYFGDIIVDDADGSFTGSGRCWAFLDGYCVSEMVMIP